MGTMIKEWVVFNKLEDINSLLNYTDDDFTPTGNLCDTNDSGKMLPTTALQEFYNLRWYIQHLIDENEYQYDDDEWTNPLSECNWIFQTNKKFMKYVNFTLHEMTPEQLKQNSITVHPNQQLDTDEGECNNNKDEEEFTTSTELSEEHSIFDIPIETTEESKPTQTSQVLTVFNKTTHDKLDSPENKSDKIADDTEGSKSIEDEEESEAIELQQVHNV